MSKKVEFTHKDVPKVWKKAVIDRAKNQDVSEHQVIMWGLHHNFKAEREDKEIKEAQKEARKEAKKEAKEQSKILRDILKELKK